MAETIYRFEFVSDANEQKEIDASIEDTVGSGASEKPSKKKEKKKKTFSTQFTKKVQDTTLNTVVISPLNTVTGGLASPVANTIKRIYSGNISAGAVVGGAVATIGIMAIQGGIRYLQNRMQELETKVESLNNEDNVLLRAGSVSKATYYSANIIGIKKKTNRG